MTPRSPTETIEASRQAYLDAIRNSRSPNTAKALSRALSRHKFDLSSPPRNLPEEAIIWFAEALKAYAPSTERLYLSAVTGFYEYLVSTTVVKVLKTPV